MAAVTKVAACINQMKVISFAFNLVWQQKGPGPLWISMAT